MKDGLSGDFHLHERLTNSIEAGVPQDRDRIFLFGRNKNSYSDTTVDWEKNFVFPGRSAFEFNWAKTDDFKIDGKLRPDENIPKELSVSHWFDRNSVESHPNSEDFFQPRAGLAKFLVVKEGDVSRKSYKRLHRHRYSPTAAYGNNEVHLHPFKARRLSVAEALAIQSMPSAFSLPPGMTLSNKFKTIGNGVPYLLSAAVAKTISESLSQSRIKEFD